MMIFFVSYYLIMLGFRGMGMLGRALLSRPAIFVPKVQFSLMNK
jgi:hypothetical protein